MSYDLCRIGYFEITFFQNEQINSNIKLKLNIQKTRSVGTKMNNPSNMKSPRASLIGISPSNQIVGIQSLQQNILEKDQHISNLQGIINKLELKNKQYSTYEQAVIQFEQRAEQAESELLKVNQKLRAKISQSDQLKKKLDQELKQKKDRASSFVRHQDYMKMSNEYKKFRDVHKNCQKAIQEQENKKAEVEAQIVSLKQQISSLNNIINGKNTEINELKLEKYNVKSNQSIQSHKELNLSQSAFMNSLTPNNNMRLGSNIRVSEESQSFINVGGETDKLNYQLASYSRQNDELRKKIFKLEQELQQYMSLGHESSRGVKSSQYNKIIQQYEASIASMSGKLSSLHRLEMQNLSKQQERRNLSVKNQELKQEIITLNNYIETLQKKLTTMQNNNGASVQSDILLFISKNEKLAREVERLQKIIGQKYEQIVELKKNLSSLQITQQTFKLVQNSINKLEEKLKKTQEDHRSEQDRVLQEQQKSFKLQKQIKRLQIQLNEVKSEMARTNRVVSQKVQKIEFQSVEIARLEKENEQKKVVSAKLAKLEVDYKKLQKMYEEELDQSNQLAMRVIILSAEVQRGASTGNISKQFIQEFESLKIKSRETQIHAKTLQERVRRLQHLHKQVVQETLKVSEHLHASHKRWNHYDTAMQRLLQFLQESNARSQQKYEQLDSNIETWLKLQDIRLKQLAKNDPLEKVESEVCDAK